MGPSRKARVPPGLSEELSYVRSIQIRECLQADVAHHLSGSSQRALWVVQFCATRKAEVDMSNEHVDVTHTIVDDSLGRAVQ